MRPLGQLPGTANHTFSHGINSVQPDQQRQLNDDKRDYILEELAVLEGCMAEGLGFPLTKQEESAHEYPLFIVYPGEEEDAFIEGKKQLKELAQNKRFNYDVRWLGVSIHEARQERDSSKNSSTINNHLQARITNQTLLKQLLQAKTKRVLILISINKSYMMSNILSKKIQAIIKYFECLLQSCIALIEEGKDTKLPYEKERRRKYIEQLTGDWHIKFLAADTLQVYNEIGSEVEKTAAKKEYEARAAALYTELFPSVIEGVNKITHGKINVAITWSNWTAFLDEAKHKFGYGDKYAHLKKSYEDSKNNVAFREAVLKKGESYRNRREINKEKPTKEVNDQQGSSENISDLQLSDNNINPDYMWVVKALMLDLPKNEGQNLKYLSKGIFNCPQLPEKFVRRNEFLDKIKENLKDKPIVVLQGMGGIGKTDLALIHLYENYNDTFKIWINAKELERDFTKFSQLMGVTATNENSKKNNMPAIIEENKYSLIKKWLIENPKWIMVIDDLDNFDEVDKYLPQQDECQFRGHLVITSRKVTWPINKVNVIEVGLMNEEQAVKMLYLKSNRENVSTPSHSFNAVLENINLGEVARLVEYYPLALNKIGDYLSANPVSDFRKYYLEHFKEQMNGESFLSKLSHKYVSANFESSITNIWHEDKKSKQIYLAYDVLSICSFFIVGQIEIELIEVWLNQNLSQVKAEPIPCKRVLNQLREYCLIKHDEKNNFITMHRVLQEVVRHKLMLNAHKKSSDKNHSSPQALQSAMSLPELIISIMHCLINLSLKNENLYNSIGLNLREMRKYCKKYITENDLGINKKYIEVLNCLSKLYSHYKYECSEKRIIKEILMIHHKNEVICRLETVNYLHRLIKFYMRVIKFNVGYKPDIKYNLSEKSGSVCSKLGDKMGFGSSIMSARSRSTRLWIDDFSKFFFFHLRRSHDLLIEKYAKKCINLCEEALNILKIEESENKESIAKIELLLGAAFFVLCEYQKAQKSLTHSLSLFKDIKDSADLSKIIQCEFYLGKILLHHGDSDSALRKFQEILPKFEKVYGAKPNYVKELLSYLIYIHGKNEDYQKKFELLKKFLNIYIVNYGCHPVLYADIVYELSNLYGKFGKISKGEQLFDWLITTCEKQYGIGNINEKDFLILENKINKEPLKYLGFNFGHPLEELPTAYANFKKYDDNNNYLDQIHVLVRLAKLCGITRLKDQETFLDKILQIYKENNISIDINIGLALKNLGHLYRRHSEESSKVFYRGCSKSTINHFRACKESRQHFAFLYNALQIFTSLFGEMHLQVAMTLWHMYKLAKDFDKTKVSAMYILSRIIIIELKFYEVTDFRLIASLYALSKLHYLSGNINMAGDLLACAVPFCEKKYKVNPSFKYFESYESISVEIERNLDKMQVIYVIKILYILSDTYIKLQKIAKLIPILERALPYFRNIDLYKFVGANASFYWRLKITTIKYNLLQAYKIKAELSKANDLCRDILSTVRDIFTFGTIELNTREKIKELGEYIMDLEEYRSRVKNKDFFKSEPNINIKEWKELFFNTTTILDQITDEIPKCDMLQYDMIQSHTHTFFTQNPCGSMHVRWKTYPENRLSGQYIAHQIRFFTMEAKDADNARAFTRYLKENGFSAELKRAKEKPSVIVDITATKFSQIQNK